MFLTIITFIIILGLLVLVHEIGHFVAARRFKVKCSEFGLGLPPRVFGFVKVDGKWKFIRGKGEQTTNEHGQKIIREYKNTIWSLNWLPLGGFVQIKGEDGKDNQEEDSFGAQKIWKRATILASGVFMNFILAAILFSIGFMIGLPQIIDDTQEFSNPRVQNPKIQIMSVVENSPAFEQGIEVNDEIITIDNQEFAAVADVQTYIAENIDDELTLRIKRDKQEFEKKLTGKETIFPDGVAQKAIGVTLVRTATVSYSFFSAIWEGILTTLFLMKLIIVTFYNIIKDLIIQQELTVEVAGPIGIAALTGRMVKLGFMQVLQFTALPSINLGILNFFPFPALDGGRFIGLLVEAVRRKPNNQKIEALIHNIGFGILMALIVLVTYHDIAKFGGRILERIVG